VPLLDNESPAAYAAPAEEFLRVLLRCSQGHISGFTIPLTPAQEELSIKVFDALLSNRKDNRDLHELLWDLVRVRASATESTIHNCPFLAWLALHAYKPDGTYIDSDAFAQLLAKLKYLVKNICMVEAHRRQAEHPQGIIG